jgi:uncharacterized protein
MRAGLAAIARRDERIFAASVGGLALQLVALAVIHASGARLALATAAAVLAPVLVLIFTRRGRFVRGLLAATLGLAACAPGLALHVPRLALGHAGVGDYTGLLVAAAGLALTFLAFQIALRGRRRLAKAAAVPVVLALLQWYALPVIEAGVALNTPRHEIETARSLGLSGARNVSFPARDGVRLAGWYVPGTGGAAVVLMHGSHGDRSDTTSHLRVLAAAGYAVLAFDARGHGDSRGQTEALGL